MSLVRINNFTGDLQKADAWFNSSGHFASVGPNPADRIEAALAEDAEICALLDSMAQDYADTVLGGVRAEINGSTFANVYIKGQFCPEHADQYDRQGHPHTMHRTVSMSFCLEEPEEGGLMEFQDPGRRTPKMYHPLQRGQIALFPGDWLHAVQHVHKGARRTLIRWYADPRLDKFNSPQP